MKVKLQFPVNKNHVAFNQVTVSEKPVMVAKTLPLVNVAGT